MAGNYWVTVLPDGSKLEDGIKDAVKEAGKDLKVEPDVDVDQGKVKDKFNKVGRDASEAMADGVKQDSKKIEDAVDGAGEKATGRFRERAKGLGRILVDAVGPEIKSVLGDRLEDTVGGALDGVLGSNAKWAGKFARTLGEGAFDALKYRLHEVGTEAERAKTLVGGIADGNSGKLATLADGFGKVRDLAQATGVEVKDLPGPIQDVVNKTSDFKNQAQEFAGVFKDLPGKIGLVGTALSELAGPLAAVTAGVYEINKVANGPNGDLHWSDIVTPPADSGRSGGLWGLIQSWMDPAHPGVTPGDKPKPDTDYSPFTLGTGNGSDQASSNFMPGGDPKRWGDTLNSGGDAYDFFSGGAPLPSSGNGFQWGGGQSRESTAKEPNPPKVGSSAVGGVSNRGDVRKGGSRIAALYDLANSLVGTPYSQALRDDCSGMVSRLATAALGMDPSVQFSTVNEGDWLMSHGFREGVGPPGSLRIGWYDHGGGNAGHTAATLPGGEHAESGGAHGSFLVGAGAAGAEDSQFEHHAWLPMDGPIPRGVKFSGGSESSSSSPGVFSSGGSGASGTATDPIYVIPLSGGGMAGGAPGLGGSGGGMGGLGGGFGGGGDLSKLGGIAAGGLMETALPQGFSDPTQWPMMKSGMAAINFFAGLGGGIPDPTGGILSGAASSMGLNIFNPSSGSPKLAPGEFNPAMTPGASGGLNLGGALSAFMPKGGDGAQQPGSNNGNIVFNGPVGHSVNEVVPKVTGLQAASQRGVTTGPLIHG